MKILIIGQFENPMYKGHFEGGAERNERTQAEALATRHDVTVVTLPTNYSPQGYKLYHFDGDYGKLNEYAKHFDVALSNAKRGNIIKKLAGLPIPTAQILLVLPSNFGMIGVQLYTELINAGNPVFANSHYNYEVTSRYGMTRKYFKDRGIAQNILEKEIVPRSYMTKPYKVKKQKRDYSVSIGRTHPEKLMEIPRDAGCRLYMTKPHKDFPHARTGKSYRTIMAALAGAHCNVVPLHAESLGVTAFEAACRGIPSVVNTKQNRHGVFTYMPDFGVYAVDSYRMRYSKIVDEIKLGIANITCDRQDLADYMFEHHNREIFIDKIEKILQKTLDRGCPSC